PEGYRGTPLEALLPAVLPPTPTPSSQGGAGGGYTVDVLFPLKLTTAGMRHPMMQLEADPAANVRRWESLPGSYWHGVVARVKPGASVLLETGDGSGAGLVLIQPVGEGVSCLTLMDSTWRW